MPGLPRIAVDELVHRLERVHQVGEGRWMARCPAHGDRGPSLSVREGEDGRILLHCFSGCEFNEVISAVGLRPEQLFPPTTARLWRPPKRIDLDAEARRGFARFRELYVTRPSPDRAARELRAIGRLLLGGTAAFARVPDGFHPEAIRCFELRVLFLAVRDLAAHGTPRRWFSPYALALEVDHIAGAGRARSLNLYFFARLAVREAWLGGVA